MRNLLSIFILFYCSHSYSYLQNIPGFYEVTERSNVAEGVEWKKMVFEDLFNSKQIINVVSVDLNKAQVLPLQKKGCHKFSKIAQKSNALVAINGGFYNSKCLSRNFLKLDEKVYSYNIIRSAGSAALLINEKGEAEIKMIKSDENPKEAIHGIGGFPLLVQKRKVSVIPAETTSFFRRQHPRTVVATNGPQKLLLITVDGRSSKSKGLNIFDLAEFMVNFGADAAMNLDGGGSTMMWVQSEGIVNTPSDGKERSVSDGLAIYN